MADIMTLRRITDIEQPQLARTNQSAILAGQSDRLTAEAIDQRYQFALHFAREHPFDDFHRLSVGDAHSLNKSRFLSHPFERFVDLRAAAMHDDRIHTHQL